MCWPAPESVLKGGSAFASAVNHSRFMQIAGPLAISDFPGALRVKETLSKTKTIRNCTVIMG